jgi:hypothetical protein
MTADMVFEIGLYNKTQDTITYHTRKTIYLEV